MEILAKEIIKESTLIKLVDKEFSLKFKAKINIGNRAFFTIVKKEMNKYNLKENELIVIRIIRNNTKYEFIGKIKKWGKINVPLKIIKYFKIKNHEEIDTEIIQNRQFSNNIKEDKIDLKEICKEKGIEVINRNNKFITIYKKQEEPITIPRYIIKSKELIEAIYLIHGDGHYKTKLFFSNTNYELHNFIINKFEELGIPKELWKFRINHSNKNLIKESKKFWIKYLEVNKDRFYETKSLSKFNTKNYGDLRIIIDNLIVSEIFKFLIKEVKLGSKLENLAALNGILDAEGSAQIGKQGLHKITISFNQDEKVMFENLLEKSELNIFEVEQNSRFCIRNWEKQYKFIKGFLDLNLIPFNKNIERKFKIITGFLNHSYTKTLIKYMNELENTPLDEKELSLKLNHRIDSIKDTMLKERYRTFISRKNNKLCINENGKEFMGNFKKLNLILKELENEYNNYIENLEKFNQEVKNEQIGI